MAQSIKKIWVSGAMTNPSLDRRMTVFRRYDPLSTDIRMDDPPLNGILSESQGRYTSGQRLEEAAKPRMAYGRPSHSRIKALPDFFKITGFIVISEAFAEVLRRFEIGEAALSPISLYQSDYVEEIPGIWWLLNFNCRKAAFSPEHSTGGFEASARGPGRYFAYYLMHDDQVAVTQAALEGCDLWMDPDLMEVFFLSDPLLEALKAAKLTRTLPRLRCRIV